MAAGLSELEGKGRSDGLRARLEAIRLTPFDGTLFLVFAIVLYWVAALLLWRPLSHDELYTYYIAKAPTVRALLSEVKTDMNPPLLYLLVRGSLALFGDNAYATRLPSMLAFLIGSLCFYRFVGTRLRAAYGLLAMLVLWSTPFFFYATEARPYALVVMWTSLALLAWRGVTQPERKPSSVALLFGAVTGMMLSHFFSVFYIAPFCLAAAWRVYQTRKMDWAVWAALLIPAAIPFAYLRVVNRFEESVFPALFQASPHKAMAFFANTLAPESPALIVAALVALAIGFRPKSARQDSALMTPTEKALTVGLFLIPVIVNVVLMRTHGAYFHRYGILALLGYGMVFAFFVARWTNFSRSAAAGACLVLFIYFAAVNVFSTAFSLGTHLRTWRESDARIQRLRPDLPLVAASGLTFLEMDKAAPAATVARLHYLTNREFAIHYAHATMFSNFPELKKVFPIRAAIEPYEQFVAEYPQFLVLGEPWYPEDWLLPRLKDVHASIRPVGTFYGPYKDYDVFEVTMPSGAYFRR